MQRKEWRVIWYDEDDREIDAQDFRHENLARSKMARVVEKQRGQSVRLYKMRWTAEATATRVVPEGWDLIDIKFA